MGHRSEKKSYKHKHHRSEKRGRKKAEKVRYEQVVKDKESEPESGEIVEEEVVLGGGGVEVEVKKGEKVWGKEVNGGVGDGGKVRGGVQEEKVREEEVGDKSSTEEVDGVQAVLENGQQQRVSKEGAKLPADASLSSVAEVCEVQVNGNGSHADMFENGLQQAHKVVHQPPSSPSEEPIPCNQPAKQARKKHNRLQPSPSSDNELAQSRDRHRQRRKSTRNRDLSRSPSPARSRSRSSDRHRKDFRERHHHHHRRLYSPGPESEIIRRRPRSTSRSGGRKERGAGRHRSADRLVDGRSEYFDRSRRKRRSSPDYGRKRLRRSISAGRRSKRSKRGKNAVDSDDDEEYRARVKAALADTMAEEDEDKLIEERRKRRQEILKKYKKPDAEKNKNTSPSNLEPEMSPMGEVEAPISSPSSAPSASNPLLLATAEECAPAVQSASPSIQNGDNMVVDDKEHEDGNNPCSDVDKATAPIDDGDIFCDTPDTSGRKLAEGLDEAVRKASTQKGLTDAYDDPEGYYNFQIGEILDNRYEVFASKGKGVFSTVLRARDKGRRNPDNEHPEVAIKMIRSNDVMKRSGQTEEEILKMLAVSDPENKRHCIRLLRSFEYRGHLCLVFEPMAMNLRELTNKFGRKVGLNIDAVGHYTAQLLVALKHLKNNKILHADIKPDNILVNEKFSRVKLCDFGSAMRQGDVEVTPYLVSRFYRSPEVILGLPYDHPMDLWSIGCVIYELFTGKILFPGKTNNEMLKFMMEVKGAFPKKMLKKGEFAEKHFENDPNMSFVQYDDDPVTKKPIKRLIVNLTVKNDFSTLLLRNSLGSKRQMVLQLAELMERMMMLDPDRRINLDMALRHPFVRHYLQRNKPESSLPSKSAPRKS